MTHKTWVLWSTLAMSASVWADHVHLPGLSVEGSGIEPAPYVLPAQPLYSGDSAEMVKRLPGVSINRNGPLTPIVQYRGMFSDRVNIQVDGFRLSQVGPNSMDPPLAYVPSQRVAAIRLYRGIAPVSSGIETIGGTIEVDRTQAEFTDSEAAQFQATASAGYASINQAHQTSVLAGVANQQHRAYVAASRDKGDNLRFRGGQIRPSRHDRDTLSAGYGVRLGQTEWGLDVEHLDTGPTGTPALPMDILVIRGENLSSRLSHTLANGGTLRFGLHYQDMEHRMDNNTLRVTSAPMRQRVTDTFVRAKGMKLHYEQQGWTLGFDSDWARYNTTIMNPTNPTFRIENFKDVRRDRHSVFAQWQGDITTHWSTVSGIRYSQIRMDADRVRITVPPESPLIPLQKRFNNANRQQTEHLFDAAAVFTRRLSSAWDLELGIARKQRAPSYQERYLWGTFESTSGLADGNQYVGTIDLRPETSYQFELGLDWHPGNFQIAPRVFYHHVNDYIQGTVSRDPQVIAARNAITGPTDRNILEFSNVDAQLYGFDTTWWLVMNAHWQLDGQISYVRGKRRDTSDNLYRLAPLTARTTLTYLTGDWRLGLEMEAIARQNQVSRENLEQQSSGYGLWNVFAMWQMHPSLNLTAGINNVLNRDYRAHLGGYNRVANNPDIAVFERLPGPGRNGYVNLNLQW